MPIIFATIFKSLFSVWRTFHNKGIVSVPQIRCCTFPATTFFSCYLELGGYRASVIFILQILVLPFSFPFLLMFPIPIEMSFSSLSVSTSCNILLFQSSVSMLTRVFERSTWEMWTWVYILHWKFYARCEAAEKVGLIGQPKIRLMANLWWYGTFYVAVLRNVSRLVGAGVRANLLVHAAGGDWNRIVLQNGWLSWVHM